MGAETFTAVGKGKTAQEAFDKAVADARHEYGNRGYTGSLAEKTSYVMITPPPGVAPVKYASDLIDNDDPRISDKWGPAGCIKMTEGVYLFFGWASS
jgi:hypothetical protein